MQVTLTPEQQTVLLDLLDSAEEGAKFDGEDEKAKQLGALYQLIAEAK